MLDLELSTIKQAAGVTLLVVNVTGTTPHCLPIPIVSSTHRNTGTRFPNLQRKHRTHRLRHKLHTIKWGHIVGMRG